MSTSGLTSFNPAASELLVYAFGLCGIRRTALVAEHMADARMAMNLMLASWGTSTPNLWTVELVSVDLTEGVATYNVAADTIMILDAYIRTGNLDNQQNLVDRIIWPISRTEYASMPNKGFEAPPTVFWFDRQLAPTITLWQVPERTNSSDNVYQLQYYRCTVLQDADVPNGVQVDIPRWWLDAFAWGLAARIAVSYAPDRAVALDAKAEKALINAQTQDTEGVSLYILPGLSSYTAR